MNTIGERFRQLRESHSLTSEQFGKIANVSKGAVSQWENNTTDPKAMALMRISHHFNISIDYLLLGEETLKRTSKLEKLVEKMTALEKQGELTDERIGLIDGIVNSWKPPVNSEITAQKTG